MEDLSNWCLSGCGVSGLGLVPSVSCVGWLRAGNSRFPSKTKQTVGIFPLKQTDPCCETNRSFSAVDSDLFWSKLTMESNGKAGKHGEFEKKSIIKPRSVKIVYF